MMKAMAWCCLLALGALSAGCGVTRAFEKPTGPHFSLLSYNVNYAAPGADETLEAIAGAGADIVLLQETTPAWEGLLRAKFSQRYPHMKFLDAPAAGGQAVLSRLPVAEAKRLPPTPGGGWFPAWILIAQTPVGPVQVANLHLRPNLNEDAQVSIGALLTTGAARPREVEALWPHMSAEMMTIVAGDINEGNDGRAVAFLVSRGLTDALPEFDPLTPTWRWPTPLGNVHSRFDHVLYGKDLRCLRAQVLHAGASDHLPVLAVFQAALGQQPSRATSSSSRAGGPGAWPGLPRAVAARYARPGPPAPCP